MPMERGWEHSGQGPSPGRAPGLSSLTKSSKGCFGRTVTLTARKEGTPGLSSIYIRGTKAWKACTWRALGSGGVLSIATHSVPAFPALLRLPSAPGRTIWTHPMGSLAFGSRWVWAVGGPTGNQRREESKVDTSLLLACRVTVGPACSATLSL